MEFDFETAQPDGEQPPVWKDEEDTALRMRFKLGQLGVRWNTKKKECAVEDKGQQRTLLTPDSVEKRIFECHSKVKKIIPHGSLVIITDSLGYVYITKDIRSRNRTVSRVKLGYFNISDAAVFDGKILCVGKNSFVMKEVDIERAFCTANRVDILETTGPSCSYNNGCSCGTFPAHSKHENCSHEKQPTCGNNARSEAVSDIMKDTGEQGYRKIHVRDKIYVLGNMLTVMDKTSYEVMYQIQSNLADLTVVDGCLYCLAHNGDILVYRDRVLVKKASFEDKFSYTKISGVEKVYLMAGNSIKVLNASLDLISERQCGFEVTCIAENDKYVVAVGNDMRSIKLLLKPQYKGVPNFPRSGMVFPAISFLAFDGGLLYYCHGRYISFVNIRSS